LHYLVGPGYVSSAEQQRQLQVQGLLACIPALVFALALIGVAAWRRKLAYTVGPLLGLLLGAQREYDITWHMYFGGEALAPALQLAAHVAHVSISTVIGLLPRLIA